MSYRRNLPFALVALAFAEDLIGVTEYPNNDGPAVRLILRAANIDIAAPWCAAFVNAAAEYAQMVKNVPSPLESVPLQGFVHSYVVHGRENGWIYRDRPYPGAIFCLWSSTKQRYAHMGLVGHYIGGGAITTVEGNSNTDGSFDGRSVVVRTRTLGQKDVILDWTVGIEPNWPRV